MQQTTQKTGGVIDNVLLRKSVLTLKALLHDHTAKILKALDQHGELSVTELQHLCRMQQSDVSISVRRLLQIGVLNLRKEGSYRIYSIDLDKLHHYTTTVERFNLLTY